jgi:hypothetical protein
MPTSATFTFTGLFVMRRDPANGEYDLGILRARDAHDPHILQIKITPDPRTGHDSREIPQEDLEGYIQHRHTRWQLAISGGPTVGVQAMPQKPGNRHDAMSGNRDLGWIINIENDEFHSGELPRERNALQPIIRLKHGRLFTTCKTDSVDKIRDGQVVGHLGFIGGGVGLEIDTSDGEEPVLGFVDQQGKEVEIFRLLETDQRSYEVSISNTPLHGSTVVGNHFHLYYDRLFTRVHGNDRFDIKVHEPQIRPPHNDICPEVAEATPDPFRCGGILVEGREPLQ